MTGPPLPCPVSLGWTLFCDGRHWHIEHVSTPFHILLAEDNDLVARTLCRVLESHGYRVTTASHGQQALEAAVEDPPDLLVTDMQMPVMAGAELIALIRLCRPDLPVILMTGYQDAVPTVQPDNLMVLIKPFVMQDLVKAVHTLLRRLN